MTLLDGKEVSEKIKASIKAEIDKIVESGQRAPHLGAILVGNNPASEAYVGHKVKACGEVGFRSTLIRFSEQVSEKELLEKVHELNSQSELDGYIVQLPLPRHIDKDLINIHIDYRKDVDGFHPVNFGRMAQNLPAYLPATPAGIIDLLKHYDIETQGKKCVVLGRSNIVGLPVSILMARNSKPGNCTVTICHSKTNDLKEEIHSADIIIAALGIPEFVKGDMVKNGAIVVDVGINRIADATKKSGYRLVGDVAFEEVAPKCSFITPVPGGVGPMTIVSLLKNTLIAYRKEIYS